MSIDFSEVYFLSQSAGRLAYSRSASKHIDPNSYPIITSPGMGELRQSFAALADGLTNLGHDFIAADLRGHGMSDCSFTEYGDEATATDLVGLCELVGRPAVLVASSMSAAAAVITAVQRPELVRALVLVGPFVRNPKISWLSLKFMHLLTKPAWAHRVWYSYLPKLYAGRKPDDFAGYRKLVAHQINRPGYRQAFSKTTRADHSLASELLTQVSQPTLIIMAEKDPDFIDPQVEAQFIATKTGGSVAMISDAGHYPHAQQPQAVLAAITDFLKTDVRKQV